jgi:hypothetical protein
MHDDVSTRFETSLPLVVPGTERIAGSHLYDESGAEAKDAPDARIHCDACIYSLDWQTSTLVLCSTHSAGADTSPVC